jgi:hypothetical protein
VPPVCCSRRLYPVQRRRSHETIATAYSACSRFIYHASVHDRQCATLISCMHAGRCHHDIVMYACTAALCVLAAVLYPAAAVAQAAPRKLTAADVRRIALASARGARSSSRLAAATSGLQQAKALGIPINTMALKRDPTLSKVREAALIAVTCLLSPPAMHAAVATHLSMRTFVATCMCSSVTRTSWCCQRATAIN